MGKILCALLLAGNLLLPKLTFTKLSVEDGLSQCTIFDIVQDTNLNMWFATYDGLCRYDGYDFKVYRHNESDSTSISGNIIRSLLVDSSGRLWAGTNAGVSVFDSRNEMFRNFYPEKGDDIYFYKLIELPDSSVLTYSDKCFYRVPKNLDGAESVSDISGGDVDWSLGHLFFYSPSDGLYDITDIHNKVLLSKPFTKERVLDVLFGQDGRIYMASNGDGLFVFDPSTGKIVRHSHKPGDPNSLCSNHLRSLCYDTAGNMWIGTGYNLSILDPSSGRFQTIKPDRLCPESLSQSSIKKIFRDNSGGMWIGTFFGGVNYYHQYRDIFRTVRLIQNDRDVIGCVRCDSKGRAWLGTCRNGVCIYDFRTGDVKWLNSDNTVSRLEAEINDIKDIAFSKTRREAYFAADLGGLMIYEEKTGKISQIGGNPRRVYSILEESESSFWLGASDGLYLFDASLRTVRKVEWIGNVSVPVLARDCHGNVWIGTSNCLYKSRLTVLNGIPEVASHSEYYNVQWAQDICVARDNSIWIATRAGLFKFDPTASVIRKVEGGFVRSGSVLKGVMEDVSGKLWISSEDGLCRHDPSSGEVQHYAAAQGLYNTVFNFKSHDLLPDGTLLFGGLDGLTFFTPADIKSNSYSPTPVISAFYAGGEPMDLKGKKKKTVLRHDQNTIEFVTSVPDYITWKENEFSYFLEGYDSKWSKPSGTRSVKYQKLPKGRYEFHVRSCNNEGVWSDKDATVSFKVLAVWYKSLVFTLIACLSALAILAYLLYYVISRVRKKNESSIARIRKESEKEIGALRFKVFINSVKPGLKLTAEQAEFLSKFHDVEMANLGKEHYGVDDIARDLCMSRSTLHAKLKESAGMSAHELFDLIRFEEAIRILEEGQLTVSEVAYRLGFSTPAYFATSFKRYTGKTPTEFTPANK